MNWQTILNAIEIFLVLPDRYSMTFWVASRYRYRETINDEIMQVCLYFHKRSKLFMFIGVYLACQHTITLIVRSQPARCYPSRMSYYNDVIMGAMASQITGLTIVCSTVCSDADQRNIKAPRHWPLWWEFTGYRWIPAQRASNAENVSIWWRHLD